MAASLGASSCAPHPITLPPPITIHLPGTLSATVPSAPPSPSAPGVALSTPQLASVYAAALLAAESLALGRHPVGALLLRELVPRDTALEHELRRRHAVAGICEGTAPVADACANDVRGFVATFVHSPRPSLDDSVDLALVEVRPMRGAFDRTLLIEPPRRHWLIMLIKRDSVWAAARAPWQH
jgi:hypothetical protein